MNKHKGNIRKKRWSRFRNTDKIQTPLIYSKKNKTYISRIKPSGVERLN